MPQMARRGERNGSAKITADQVRAIRAAYEAGVGPAALGRQYGLHRNYVLRIVNGETWAHID